MKKFLLAGLVLLILLLLGGGGYWFKFGRQTSATKTQHPAQAAAAAPANPAVSNSFNKSLLSIDDPTSLWVVVNKQRPLQPKTYTPPDLVVPKVPLHTASRESVQIRQPAATALEQLFASAKQAGIQLSLSSAYRSYPYQTSLYNSYVKANGQAQADTFSARPGFSEHQAGLAADVSPANGRCNVEVCFADLPEGKWLAAHAYEHGFIIRYPAADTPTTGYTYEPWHIRYVGPELAAEMHRQNISTLEQFFNLGAAPHY